MGVEARKKNGGPPQQEVVSVLQLAKEHVSTRFRCSRTLAAQWDEKRSQETEALKGKKKRREEKKSTNTIFKKHTRESGKDIHLYLEGYMSSGR